MSERRRTEPSAFDLADQAFALLRGALLRDLPIFYLGTVPFVLALLFFVEEMSRSPHAAQRLGTLSLRLALLYLVMKVCQAVFAHRVAARHRGETPPPLGARGCLRLAANQAAWQPWSLLVLPLAVTLTAPFGYAYAFFHSLAATADAPAARRAAVVWQRQNSLLVLLLGGFGLVLLLNFVVLVALAPTLARIFFGIESEATRTPIALLSGTTFAAAWALAYLALAPLVRTCYALRAWYAAAFPSGADLELRLARGRALAAAIVAITLGAPGTLLGQATPLAAPADAPPQGVPAAIERALDRTAERADFAWRQRAPVPDPEQQGWLKRQWQRVQRFFDRTGNTIARALDRLFRWLRLGGARPPANTPPLLGLPRTVWVILLAAVLAALTLVLFLRLRRREPPAAAAATGGATLQLDADPVQAALHPAEEWHALARTLRERGQPRDAARALYLGLLSRLAAQELIATARHKTTLDYRRELERKSRPWPAVGDRFRRSSNLFERVWYGEEPATAELVDTLETDLSAQAKHVAA